MEDGTRRKPDQNGGRGTAPDQSRSRGRRALDVLDPDAERPLTLGWLPVHTQSVERRPSLHKQ